MGHWRFLRFKPAVAVICLLLAGGVAVADLSAPPELNFALLYLVPLLLAAWYVGDAFAIILCAMIAGVVVLDNFMFPGRSVVYVYWNTITRFAALLIVAWAVSALRKTNESLRASEALREDLTNMLVHDLKNPLTSASMALNLLRRSRPKPEEPAPDQGQEDELLRIAQESQERLGRLIEDILDLARTDSGTPLVLDLASADLVEVAREAVQPFHVRAENAGIHLEERYLDAPVLLTLDRVKIQRLLGNLLDNALKNTPPDGHVEVIVAAEDSGARVTVRDTGPGVPEEMRQRIFDKFVQAGLRASGVRMSVGLGLAFCRLVAEAHGGRIWVESELGQGSSFIFTLPAAPPATKSVTEALTA